MAKATVKTPTGNVEVELSDITMPEGHSILAPGQIPEGFVNQETMNATISQRLARQKTSLQNDGEFVNSILTSLGVPLDESGKVKLGKDVDTEAIRTAIINELVNPLNAEKETLKGRVEKLMGSRRAAEILKAANRHNVHENYLKPLNPNDPKSPTIWENMIGSQLGYDEANDMFAVKHGDTFAPSTKQGTPWKDVDQFHESLKSDDNFKNFFAVEAQPNTGFNSGVGVGTQSVSRDDFRNGRLSKEQISGIAKGEISVAE